MSFYPGLRTTTMPVADIDVNVYAAGTPRPGIPSIVLVHGTGGTLEGHFGTMFSMLAGRQHVVGMDLVTPDGRVQLDDLVEQVVAVIRSLDGPVVLVGYSLGAVVAAAVAGRQPPLVERLVLLAGWVKTDGQQRLRNDVWRELFSSQSKAMASFSTLMFFGSAHVVKLRPDELETIVSEVQLGPGLDEQMDLNRRIDISADVQSITAPTLIVGGTYDQMVPLTHSRQLYGAIAQASIVEIPTGHAMTIERPAQLFALIDDFTTAFTTLPDGTVLVPATI